MIDVGTAFFCINPHHINHKTRHRHLSLVVQKILQPGTGKELAMCFYFTSVKYNGYEDLSCTFNRGDHNFFKHKSYIDYSQPFIMEIEQLENQINEGIFKLSDPFTDAQIQYIKECAKKSDAISEVNLRRLQSSDQF